MAVTVTDPPYEFKDTTGGGIFGTCRGKSAKKQGRTYHASLTPMSCGISNEILQEMLRVLKKPNIYIFCNKEQLPQYLNFALSKKLNFDILCWHKTNPTPMCNNKYLSDTEYIVFIRKGAAVYGNYATKKKYFIQSRVSNDIKHLWKHPTIKPLNIVETFIINSSKPGDVVLDPFIGSGTTAIACIRQQRKYIGYEINTDYYNICMRRVHDENV